MASGQQKAQQNLEAFEVWKATQTDDDFRQIVHRGQLNRSEVAKAIGCGKSALNQNPALKKALKELEDELRDRGVLPPLTETARQNKDTPKLYDNTVNRRLFDSKKMAELEAENIELKAENITLKATINELKADNERYSEVTETLVEHYGVLPR